MKTFNNQTSKWLLSTALIAVLASTYSFQSLNRQINSGEIHMSSTDGEPNQPEVKKTEADTTAVASCSTGDCETVVTATPAPTANDIKSLKELIDKLTLEIASLKSNQNQVAAQAVETKKVSGPYADICGEASQEETRQEKRDRLDCEKKEKAKIAQETLEEKFLDKIDSIADKCDSNIECLAMEFSSLTSRYTGSKAIRAQVVNSAFKSLLGAELNKKLYSDNPEDLEATTTALQDLIMNIPSEYKTVKQVSMELVKNQAQLSSQKVSQGYAQLNELSKQNNPQAYFELSQTVRADHQKFNYMTQNYSNTLKNAAQYSEDSSILAYYQRNYVPEIQKIMANTLNPNAAPVNQNTVNTTANQNQPEVNNTTQPSTRDERSTSGDTKMTLPNNSGDWSVQNQQGQIQFGPATNTQQGTRSAR